jgi:hypothetical protein
MALISSTRSATATPRCKKTAWSVDADQSNSYIGFTSSRTGLWGFFRESFLVGSRNEAENYFRPLPLNCRRQILGRSAFPFPIPMPPSKWPSGSKPAGKIPGSARCGHDTTQQENTGGNPPSGREKPELSFLVLFTPQKNMQYNTPAGDEIHPENQSWKCAFI